MKIYTKKGDKGNTRLLFGDTVSKDNLAPEAYGSVDELVASLGIIRAEKDLPSLTQEIILQIQRELFIVGAELATSKENRGKLKSGKTLVEDSMIKNLEAKIDILEEKNGIPEFFVVPGENPISAEEAEAEYSKSERGLRYQLIEAKLIQENALQITREEVEDFAKDLLKKQMAQYGRTDVKDEELNEIATRIMGNQEEVKRISDQVMSEKMRQLFLEKGNIKVKKVTYDAFIKEAYKK